MNVKAVEVQMFRLTSGLCVRVASCLAETFKWERTEAVDNH